MSVAPAVLSSFFYFFINTQMVDANQKWDVQDAINYMAKASEFNDQFHVSVFSALFLCVNLQLAEFELKWIEEPTSPDDVLGHLAIKKVYVIQYYK